MKSDKACKLLLIFFLIAQSAFAQPKAKIQHYATEEGLSHVAVTYIIKDQMGFMWFATWDGISRFDGNRFVSYKSVPGDRSPLKSDRIDTIVPGNNDHLWLKAYDNQIYNFNKSTGHLSPLNAVFPDVERSRIHFKSILYATDRQLWLQSANNGVFFFPDVYTSPSKYFQFQNGADVKHQLPSNKVNFFHIDKQQRIWVGTRGGLTCLRKNSSGNYEAVSSPLFGNDEFTDAVEGDRFLYLASASGKLYIRDKNTGITTLRQVSNGRINKLLISRKRDVLYISSASGALSECELQQFSVKLVSHFPESINALFEDTRGNVWIEPGLFGVYRYNPADGKSKFYSQQTDINSKFLGNHFRIFEDTNGLVWVSLKKGGFGYYDEAKDCIAYFYNDPHDLTRKFSNNVSNFYYDPAGVLWLITDEYGVEKIVFQANSFYQLLLKKPGLFKSENDVRGLTADNKGRLWVGTKGKQLYVIENGHILPNMFVNEPKGGLGQVYTIMQDSKGIIWLGTKSNGLYKAEPVDHKETAYRLTHYINIPNTPQSIGSNEIYTVLEDTRGRIWVGSFDEGINLLVPDGASARFIHQSQLLKGVPAGAFRKIRKFTMDGNGNIWAATTSGLLVIKNQSDQIPFNTKTYNKIPGDTTSLGNNGVQVVYKDSHDSMWLGTSGGGLSRAITQDPLKAITFKNYTSGDGLMNDYLLSICGDKNQCLWLASPNGLTRFNTVSGQFHNYDTFDGIPQTVFSETSCAYTTSGEMVFGTMNGLLLFRPEQMRDYRILGQIAFTDLQVNNQDVSKLQNLTLLPHQINSLTSLNLKSNQNIISFDYAVLDYRSANKQNYSYRLRGFDSTWHSNRGLQRATYTNLPPGNYQFEVKCISTGLYTNVPYKSLYIYISPPLWQTWWAYLLYVIVALCAFFAIRKNALTMLRLRHRIAVEQKLTALKTNFFTNISHEMRTPLTLIINPITAIAETEELSDRGREYIAIVQKNAGRMARFINQLLDLRKVQSGNAVLNYQDVEIVSFIKDISQYFNDIAKEKNISLSINANAAIICRIDLDKIDIVIYNILANAYKFSFPNKHIGVKVAADAINQTVDISFYDEGGGVPEDSLKDLFKLFYEGGHHQQKGTGIGLALSKEMVELHGGSIWAVNNNNGGLTVNVRLKTKEVISLVEDAGNAGANQVVIATPNNIGHSSETLAEPDAQLILLVEDNADLRTFLKLEIGERYRVVVAENGLQGLKIARQLTPDLIISDIMMPEMDGITMLSTLKNDTATSHIPIILLSARHAIEDQIEGLKYGADYYITKPFNNDFLLASINNIVGRRRAFFQSMLDDRPKPQLISSDMVITSQDEIFLQKVIKIVEEGMVDPNFNIDHVASLMNMSRSPLYKKLKSLTNLAPVEFIREMRLKRAKQYLDAGDTVINDIAYKVGFYNVKYFSTCFKDQYKKSPTDYIKQIVLKSDA